MRFRTPRLADIPVAPGGEPRTTLVVAAFLLLHLVTAYVRRPVFWGTHMLELYPISVQVAFLFLGAVLLTPSLQQSVIDSLARLPRIADPWARGRPATRFAVGLVAAGLLLFFLLRATVHLLGDGQLHVRALDNLSLRSWSGPTSWTNNNSPLCYWLVEGLHLAGKSVWGSGEISYQVYAYLSGAMYLLVALLTARLLGRSDTEKAVVLGFLVTPGFLQLFAGYAETYAFPVFLLLLYLYVSLRALRSRSVPWLPAIVLGVLLSLHYAMVTLLPSLVALVVLQARSGATSRGAVGRVAVGAACLGIVVLVSSGVLTLIGFDPLAILRQERSHLLPVFAAPDIFQSYRLFDPAHFFDVFNQTLLVAPAAVITLLLLRSWRPFADGGVLFVLSAFSFPFLFTFVANPEVGAFRDWDAFAYAGLPLTLVAAMILIRQEQPALAHTGWMIAGASLLHTLLWIGVNARPAETVARFEQLLERGHLSDHGRAYGWETVGTYYWSQSAIEDARTAYERAIAANDENPRYWNMVGTIYNLTGEHEKALEYFAGAIERDPDLASNYFHQGEALFALDRLPEALESFRKAVSLDPTHGKWHCRLGFTCYRLGRFPEAEEALRTAIARDAGYVDAYFFLGVLCRETGRREEAAACARRVLELEPDGPRAGPVREWLGGGG